MNTKTRALLAKARDYEKRAATQMPIDAPIGSVVTWFHGEHARRGKVVGYGWGHHLRVEGINSGKEQWIHFPRIESIGRG